MSFKSLLILVYSLAGLLIALFSAFMTYLIIGEPIGMKMFSKISLVVLAALPVIALISYGVGRYFFGKFEGIRYRLEQIAHGNFVSIEPQERIVDVERIHRSITLLSERLSELIESLQKQNETISNMTLSLAHDIKTPLMIINGYLEEIRDALISPEDLPKIVDKMGSECSYIDDLTSDVLAYLSSMNPNREREEVVIYDVVYEILPLIPLSADTHWNIDLPREVIIEFNRMDLKKVLMNLLHNSSKFTSRGVITIRIDENKIIIEDTGCGIDPQFFPRLFEPYSTADTSRNRQKSGLGLGLSITKNLVLNNGYELVFDESVTVGTRAIIRRQYDYNEEILFAKKRFERIFDNNASGILVVDENRQIVMSNKRFSEIIGYSKEELLGQNSQIIHESQSAYNVFKESFLSAQKSSNYKIEFRLKRKDNERIWCEILGSPIELADHHMGVVWSVLDVTKQKQLQNKLEEQAIVDFLTGLYNRRYFTSRLKEQIFLLQRNHEAKIALMMFDLDHFKRINDTFGHFAGDTVIKEFAEIIKNNLRKTDIAGRIGGEEFAIILPDTSIENALMLATRIKEEVAVRLIQYQEKPISFTVSIGVTMFDHDDLDIDMAFVRADTALYTAKENGRNRIEKVLKYDSQEAIE